VSGTQPPDIRAERVRLTAQWLNTIAAGFVVAGAVTPLATGRVSWSSAIYAIIFAGLGWVVHRYARDSLGELQ
jgi:hypothetical protein